MTNLVAARGYKKLMYEENYKSDSFMKCKKINGDEVCVGADLCK